MFDKWDHLWHKEWKYEGRMIHKFFISPLHCRTSFSLVNKHFILDIKLDIWFMGYENELFLPLFILTILAWINCMFHLLVFLQRSSTNLYMSLNFIMAFQNKYTRINRERKITHPIAKSMTLSIWSSMRIGVLPLW